jgi:hypothetical protein
MMKKLQSIMVAAATMWCCTAAADSYNCLTIGSSDGSQSFEVSTISKITFDSENMIVWNGETEAARLPLATLSKMSFSATDGITAVEEERKISVSNGVLRVPTRDGERITLYNMRGEAVKSLPATGNETEINLSGMKPGVYIIKVGNRAEKIINRSR